MSARSALVAGVVVALATTPSPTLGAPASSSAASASPRGSLDQIEHVIIFMQENRPLDFMYGTLQGVRGFNDRTAIPLPNGLSSFYQPTDAFNITGPYMLPFHVSTMSTSAICMDAPAMSYPTDIGMWNGGRYDAWNTARGPGMGMSHFNRSDLPYYYALYDEFTLGDQYFQATFTQTNPNRLHLFSGSNGLSVGEMAVLDNSEPTPGWTWPTMGEILEDAGVSWKVYQEADNFDDNGFAWFKSFQESKPGDALYDKGMARVPDIVAALDADMAAGNLSQVSYLIAPAFQSEHAAYHPSIGEDLSARILKTISSYPDLYAKTLFILNYDEGGQFYDHHWTPTAPQSQPGDGLSTVNTTGEVTTVELPIGLGFRVPLLLVSPWTRGKRVISQVFDHTSVIKFLEQRFNVSCPNISPWRRAITGDLTLALDLDNPDYSWPTGLPDTSGYVNQSNWECANLPPPSLPSTQSYPTQEPGTRISVALPYEFLVSDAVSPGAGASAPTLALSINVTGASAAPFLLIDGLNGQKATPRKYAVASGTGLTDPLSLPSWSSGSPSPSRYAWSLHGPNGFVRQFGGDIAADNAVSLGLQASLSYDVAGTSVVLSVSNAGTAAVTFTLTDNAYGFGGPWTIPVAANGGSATQSVNVSSSGQWYDFTASIASSSPGSNPPVFQRRFMGRMETGQDSITDPAMGNGVPPTGLVTTGPAAGTQIDAVFGLHRIQPRDRDPAAHPPVPESHRYWKRVEGDHKDARWHFTVPANMNV